MKTKAFIAEFVGTFAFIFIGISAIATNYTINGRATANLVSIGLAQGFLIAVMVSATAAVSGGHLNPAVTFGAWVAGKLDLRNAIGYVIFQCLGAIFAASLVKLAFPPDVLQAVGMGIPALGKTATPLMAWVMEIMLSFFLVFVVFGTALDRRAPKMGGLFIGLTVALDILAGGRISGAGMNPARYLGPAIVSGNLQDFWIYSLGPLVGGAAAALLYHFVLEERRQENPSTAEVSHPEVPIHR